MPTRHADPVADWEAPGPPMDLMLRYLAAQHREIIVATYFRRRTTREAARVLGLTPAAATARLYHAMSDLSLMMTAGQEPPAGRARWWSRQERPAARTGVRRRAASRQ